MCLSNLLCCNHFTLMLYYRQHLCVALSAEACEMYFEIGFLLPAGTQNAAHNISYWSTASNNQLPLVFLTVTYKVIQNCPTRNFRLKSPLLQIKAKWTAICSGRIYPKHYDQQRRGHNNNRSKSTQVSIKKLETPRPLH